MTLKNKLCFVTELLRESTFGFSVPSLRECLNFFFFYVLYKVPVVYSSCEEVRKQDFKRILNIETTFYNYNALTKEIV